MRGGDNERFFPWIVCEPERRWLTALRRFAPEQMPHPLVPMVMPAQRETVLPMIAGRTLAVIWWTIRPSLLRDACDGILETAAAAPTVLQLAAVEGLNSRERLLLCELPCATTVSHPEELPRLTPMIQGYFAIPPHLVD